MNESKDPGQMLDERYQTVIAKELENAQAIDRLTKQNASQQREIDELKRYLLPKGTP